MSYQLVLIRHGESEWNKANLFTGWTDVDLSQQGHQEAIQAGKTLKEEGFVFDVCYTSVLKRAIHTANHVLEELDQEWIPVIKNYKLNERHYGALQGLNKSETAEKYGEEQVKIWRRSFDVQPPALQADDKRNAALQNMYRNIDPKELPLTESLKDTIARVIPYFESVIQKDILEGKKVLIAAHGNSLRALFKYLNDVSNEEIVEINIPTGIPLIMNLDENLKAVSYHYLGNADVIQKKMDEVKNQGKK